MQRRHMVEVAAVLVRRERRARTEQGVAHVAQQDHPDRAVEGRGDHRVVEDGRETTEDAALPQPHVGAARVASRPQQPVVPRVLVLEHELLPIDADPFEASPRLGVVGLPGRAALGAVEERRQVA